MKIKRMVMAGSLESNDALITLKPMEEGIELEIDSIVEKQFKDAIEKAIYKTLERLNVNKAFVKVQDKGALDCVLEARMETAILRGGTEEA